LRSNKEYKEFKEYKTIVFIAYLNVQNIRLVLLELLVLLVLLKTKLVNERTASEELSQQTCRWYLAFRERLDILEELQQTVCLVILVSRFWNLLKKRFCLCLDNGKLKEHSGIEHSIRILLIRENPLVLSSPYTWPSANGFLSRTSTILVIAYYSA
jgi:hypothetical protein